MKKELTAVKSLNGVADVPGDKSISHRTMIFGAIAEGTSVISGLLDSGDVHSTQNALRAMGVRIEGNAEKTLVHGVGKHGLKAPTGMIDCGNSGTTMRLMMGLLAGQNFTATLTGDDSLIRRPMKRVAAPLTEMGAQFVLTNNDYAPVKVLGQPGRQLKAIRYHLKVASAQVKTSLLLAGLYADGTTTLTGELGSRDHTERMFPSYGVHLDVQADSISISNKEKLKAVNMRVPGDPSSAAFWMAAAAIVPNSDIQIRNVSLNPTRTGFLKVLQRMGAEIEVETITEHPEPLGHIRVRSSELRGTHVQAHEIPTLIDEIPILAIVATQAEGKTLIEGAEELRVKESDRIETVAKNLRGMGVKIETFQDGFQIEGPQPLQGTHIETFLDHRIAMSFSIAALIAKGITQIHGVDSVLTSYPQFYDVLDRLQKG